MAKAAKTAASTTAKQTTTKGPSAKQLSIPLHSIVRYTGKRTEHAGEVGEVIGYRGPTTGLWVKFPSGTASISLKGAELVTKGAKSKLASKAASRTAKPKAAKPAKPASEPEQEASEQSA
jgi:hypothetical protein